jgi:hypothetical protein
MDASPYPISRSFELQFKTFLNVLREKAPVIKSMKANFYPIKLAHNRVLVATQLLL